MGKKARQIFSGLLSLLTLFSVVTQPLMGLASEMPETEAYEVEYPPLEAVKDLLAEDEIVTAEDYILDAGSIFDIGHDFAIGRYNGTGIVSDGGLGTKYNLLYLFIVDNVGLHRRSRLGNWFVDFAVFNKRIENQ